MVPTGTKTRLSSEQTARVERALRVVYSYVLPSILKKSSPGWGPGALGKERSWDFFCALASELGEWPQRLAEGQDATGASIRRMERAHQEEAAGELVTLIRRMPTPVRVVVEARACGVSWRRMTRELPDRAFFSMQEDWRSAVDTLHHYHEDLIRRLS